MFNPTWTNLVWLIPALAFVITALSSHCHEVTVSRIARGMSIASSTVAILLFSVWICLNESIKSALAVQNHLLAIHLDLALSYDRSSAVFSLLTAFFQAVIVRFSRVYLHREPGYSRFFSLIFLLSAGMQLLAVADNFMVFFMGWELIGLASFLLVAFYRQQERSALNALKIIGVYRIGDLGLIFGMIFLHVIPGLAAEARLSDLSMHMSLAGGASPYPILVGIGVMIAAAAKSAQFPFTFWLPKAMEGPTPSSAIFYGALSVHAGVLLLLRLAPIWSQFAALNFTVGAIGFLTLVLATGSSRVQTSIKGQLAYSSAAQVGIIFLELSFGWFNLALYHVVSHALIRALQLLTSPSVIARYLTLQRAGNQRAKFSNWSFEKLLPFRVRSSLYVLALHDNYLEHAADILLTRPVQRVKSNRWIWGVSLSAVVVSGLFFLSGSTSSTTAFALTILAQGGILAAAALTEQGPAQRAVDFLGTSILLIAVAAICVKPDHAASIAGLTLAMAPFWIFLRMELTAPRRKLKLDGFNGLFATEPRKSWLLLVAIGALVGLPVLPGFFFEDQVFVTLMHESLWAFLLAAVVMCINGIAAFRLFGLTTMGTHSSLKVGQLMPSNFSRDIGATFANDTTESRAIFGQL